MNVIGPETGEVGPPRPGRLRGVLDLSRLRQHGHHRFERGAESGGGRRRVARVVPQTPLPLRHDVAPPEHHSGAPTLHDLRESGGRHRFRRGVAPSAWSGAACSGHWLCWCSGSAGPDVAIPEVPLNVRVGRYDVPVGLVFIFLVLTAAAVVNPLHQDGRDGQRRNLHGGLVRNLCGDGVVLRSRRTRRSPGRVQRRDGRPVHARALALSKPERKIIALQSRNNLEALQRPWTKPTQRRRISWSSPPRSCSTRRRRAPA